MVKKKKNKKVASKEIKGQLGKKKQLPEKK